MDEDRKLKKEEPRTKMRPLWGVLVLRYFGRVKCSGMDKGVWKTCLPQGDKPRKASWKKR